MIRLVLLIICALALQAAEDAGIRPRPDTSDYPVYEAGSKLAIAAEVLNAEQVANTFATDLNKGWIVLEVALYPKDGPVTVDTSAFVLRVSRDGQKALVRPASPKTIAGILQRKEAPPEKSDVTLYPTVGVGYETGPGRYDPVTGRRGGGLTTGVGLGVGIGGQADPPQPASTPADRTTMELELSEKALPDGSAVKPVAGYLYFPRPSARFKYAPLELEYHGDSETIKLALPRAPDSKK
jgi:hypothetical protein